MVVDYLWVAARGATNGDTVTFSLGGADRPSLKCMVVDYIREPWSRARLPCIENPSVKIFLSTARPLKNHRTGRVTGCSLHMDRK